MRHAKVLMMVGGLLLATGQMAQGQTLFDEDFNYTGGTSGSFPGTVDATWTLVGNSPHFANPNDGANEFQNEIGSGLMANFHGTTGAAKKDLIGGTYNLANLTGTQAAVASWDAINSSGSRSSSVIMRLADSNGDFLAVGATVLNGGVGRQLGVSLVTNTGATDYIDLNNDYAPNTRTGPSCSGTSTDGCNAYYIESYMEVNASTVRLASRLRLLNPPQGNVTDRGLVISTNALSHSLGNIRHVEFSTNTGLGEFHDAADNYEVIVGNSLIPEPATLSLLGLGSLLLLRRRRRA
jgi:hypothetical protein